ncbi:hypothetical protein ACOSP7_022523 [Xanthoceras sorbifolium]
MASASTNSSSAAKSSQFLDVGGEVVEENSNGQQIFGSPCLKEFSFADLKTATSNFEPDALLGKGKHWSLYKGWADDKTLAPTGTGTGVAVAIKILDHESIEAFEQWQAEVNILGRRYHPNLIELLGYCWEGKIRALVYEFMLKGSLENQLFQDAIEPMSWNVRLNIAIGAARGLAFLHTLEKQIIYRDFKTSAIVLDAKYNPKLTNFSLAKLGPSGEKTHVTTRMMGTYGYVAPEYFETGHLNVKSDVYSFGVVLLELLTGLRALDLCRTKDNLVEWLKPLLLQSELNTIMDVRMEGQYSFEVALQTAILALKCLGLNPKFRPSMKDILEELVQIQAMTSTKEVAAEVLEHIEAVTSTKEVPEVLEPIRAATSMKEVPEVLEHIVVTSTKEASEVLESIGVATSTKEVPEVLEPIGAATSTKVVPEVLEHVGAVTYTKEIPEVLEHIRAVTYAKEIPEVLEHIKAVTYTKEVPEVLEHIGAVTSMKEVPEVWEHIEAMEEKPKNSKFSSQRSTGHRGHGQPRSHHRFLTSLKATFQCVSSKH